jgi:VWFA-related protein
MCLIDLKHLRDIDVAGGWARALLLLVMVAATLGQVTPLAAQSSQQSTSKPQQKPTQAPPAEAGGPQGDIGPIAVPKKKEEPPPPEPPKPKKSDVPEFSITKDVGLVTVDVMVTTKDGQFIPGLKKDNFRVLEDGVPQKVSNFSQSEAPITAVLLVEFANTHPAFAYDALTASYAFADSLKKEDWVAVVMFDIKPQILADFTQDKRAIYSALNVLRIPTFRDTNVFDALYDTLDRLEGLEGRKYVVLVASGRDTFSRITYDKVLAKVKLTPNVTIFPVSTGRALREYIEARSGGAMGARVWEMDFLQADNQMNTFARMTGGRAYFPRLEGELPSIFRDIANSIRNQYTLAYHPSNPKLDGTFRKLKVELTDGNGGPLTVKDQKGKTLKYNIIAREGYTAKHQVE